MDFRGFLSLLFLTVLVIYTAKSHCTNGMCEKVSLSLATNTTKKNFSLVGYVFQKLGLIRNWKQCFNVCLQNCQCLSFNFNRRSQHNWKLWAANTKLEPEALRKKEGVSYYELVRSYNDMKVRNLSRTCFKVISAYVSQVIKNLPQADKQLAQKFVIQFKSLGKRFGPTCHWNFWWIPLLNIRQVETFTYAGDWKIIRFFVK